MNDHLKKFAAATNNELFDPEYKGGEWMVNAVETRETLDDFIASSKKWNGCGGLDHGTIARFSRIVFPNAQPLKGMPRCTKSVVDFGDVRFAIDTDLRNFA